MTASPPLPAGPEIVDPAPDAFVLPFNRLKPGFDPEQLPRFRDLAWRLALISPRESNRSLVIDWSRCPAGLRPGMMRAAFAELHVPTPAVLLQQRASRSTTQPGTLRHTFQIWIRFAIWLGGRGITELSQVTTSDLEAYAEHLRPLDRRWRTDAKALWVISRLWAYAPYLPERDRLVMPPWEDPATVMYDFLGTNDDTPDGENNVAIVHPAVMAPLLVWALRTVLDLAPDILSAARAHRRLLAAIPDRAPRGGTETAAAHLRGLLAAGRQLLSSGAPGATAVRARFGGPLPPMANTYLAGTLGVTTSQIARARGILADELTPADFGPAPLLDVPLTSRIGAAPWRETIGFDDVDVLMLHLSTTALICCAYLSGMRPEGVLALRRGCCTRVERDDDTVRFEIRGRHFKGVLDEDGNTIGEGEQRADPWIVLEPVARAIAVVEELEDGEQLFTRTLYRYAKGGRTALCDMSRATGQPWCDRCQQRWVACSGCGTVAQARSGTWEEPLCAKCTNPDPDFWGRCPVCTITWQLSTRPCQRCVLDQQVRDLLGGATGAIRPELSPFHEALTSAERPDVAFAWVSRSKARDLLERIGRDERPVTHAVLDELPPGKVLAHLRSVLVTTGALPPRDERLVALEKWITTTVQARTDLAERRILHGYAVWHHMRRLRRRLGDAHTTRLQDLNVRSHVTAANNFLDWLGGEGLTPGTCTQTDLERWMADPTASYRDETGHFVRWSVQHRHALDLTYGTVRWTGPLSTIDSEKR